MKLKWVLLGAILSGSVFAGQIVLVNNTGNDLTVTYKLCKDIDADWGCLSAKTIVLNKQKKHSVDGHVTIISNIPEADDDAGLTILSASNKLAASKFGAGSPGVHFFGEADKAIIFNDFGTTRVFVGEMTTGQ